MGMLLSQQVPRWFVLHACLDSVKRLLGYAGDCMSVLSCLCAGIDFGQLCCRPASVRAQFSLQLTVPLSFVLAVCWLGSVLAAACLHCAGECVSQASCATTCVDVCSVTYTTSAIHKHPCYMQACMQCMTSKMLFASLSLAQSIICEVHASV
jgi:hypothetical protein